MIKQQGWSLKLVERVHLTTEFVKTVLPPERGERWIGDSEISGFGLRLWATRSGEGKAFALRTSLCGGKSVRRSFDPRESVEYRFAVLLNSKPEELGSYLSCARRWAWSEIIKLEGEVLHFDKLDNIRTRAVEQRLLSTVQEVAEDLF